VVYRCYPIQRRLAVAASLRGLVSSWLYIIIYADIVNNEKKIILSIDIMRICVIIFLRMRGSLRWLLIYHVFNAVVIVCAAMRLLFIMFMRREIDYDNACITSLLRRNNER